MLSTVFFAASPVIAFPLAVGITDPPVIALMLLTLALLARPSGLFRAAAALGVACAMKATAWPAVPVFASMLAARDAARSAWRFTGIVAGVTVLLSVASAPAALAHPWAFMQNTVLFPLGLSKYKTPAASPLPGHLLASTGMAGHWAAVALLLAAGLGFAVSLVVRPPDSARAAAWRLAVGLAVMFTLAPATRWGYFVYPIGLAGWLLLTRTPAAGTSPPRPGVTIPAQATGKQTLPAAAGAGLRECSGADPPGLAVSELRGGQPVDRGAGGGEHQAGRLGVDAGGHLVHPGGELVCVAREPGQRERLEAEGQVHHLGRVALGGHQVHHPPLGQQQQRPPVAEVVGVDVRPHAG